MHIYTSERIFFVNLTAKVDISVKRRGKYGIITSTKWDDRPKGRERMEMEAMLYVVGTPIGNLEDLSYRAVRVLSEVDCIYAEDTRHSLALLQHIGVKKPMRSCHEHNERQRLLEIEEELIAGRSLALISDAGLPGISDPGGRVIAHLAEKNLPFTVIPGPNAALTALLLSALPSERFVFEGFLPREKKQRQQRLESLQRESRSIILYESPLRVISTFEELREWLGDRPAALCRELTKRYETCLRGKISQILEILNGDAPRGECVLVLAGREAEEDRDMDPSQRMAKMQALIDEGMRAKEAAKRLCDESFSANDLYKLYLQEKK